MPRNVRPSWCILSVDPSGNNPQPVKATGPQSRRGTLSALFKVRDRGAVLDLLAVDMIGSADGQTVCVQVVDLRKGRVLFSETFQQ